MSLPSMIYTDKIRKRTQAAFGGYNHNLAAADGEIYDMEGMTSDYYPIYGSRLPRYLLRALTVEGTPNGYYALDGELWASGTELYADGKKIADVSDSRKTFATLGMNTLILPDKIYYNRLTGEVGKVETEVSGEADITDGTYADVKASANTIDMLNVKFTDFFKVGDAVEISGCVAHKENNKVAIIREIEGCKLRFYENTFVIGDHGDTEKAIKLKRVMPDLDFICESDNRLWGCKGSTVYASKLGDLCNWNVFDGLSTDAYACDVGSAGDFTGCFTYLGYPCFFKEHYIYKVYGDKPSNFQIIGSATMGAAKGSSRSFAVAGEVLYYLSSSGICAYTGGIPQSLAAPFGEAKYKNAVGGSDGRKYYVSMEDDGGIWSLFVYDTQKGIWVREEKYLQILDFGKERDLTFLDTSGRIWLCGNASEIPEDAQKEREASICSFLEFGDFIYASPDKKGISKLQLRLDGESGCAIKILICYDSGSWEVIKELTVESKRSFYVPVIPRRCDHFRLKIEAEGSWKLYSLAAESYAGSAL